MPYVYQPNTDRQYLKKFGRKKKIYQFPVNFFFCFPYNLLVSLNVMCTNNASKLLTYIYCNINLKRDVRLYDLKGED